MNARHLLGISGGKDSAALAIYLKDKYPTLPVDYYTCDTGKELDETYQLIENLEVYLGKPIRRLKAAAQSSEDPFDHFLKLHGGFLPSPMARWCTKSLKLDPFEQFVGSDPVVSYVGIRGDEDREGYISKKPNIQSIFPFRQNIWSEDVVQKILANPNIEMLLDLYCTIENSKQSGHFLEILGQPISPNFNQNQKLRQLLDFSVRDFNHLVFAWLKNTAYPLALETVFPLVENEEILVRDDIFRILRDSGVGVPGYYEKVEFESGGKNGHYSRSRSGCYFCFFQQKIEWVWLFEQHPELFAKAIEYEKAGYTWTQNESLQELTRPQRIAQIKSDFLKKSNKPKGNSPYLLDILDEEETGCAACFI